MNKILQILEIKKTCAGKVFDGSFLLAVFRLMAVIPIPGVDAIKLREFFASNQLFDFLNIFSGGALSNLSIMMLGVSPYITATIILQL